METQLEYLEINKESFDLTRLERFLELLKVRCTPADPIDSDFIHATSFHFSNRCADDEWDVTFLSPVKVCQCNQRSREKSKTYFKTVLSLAPKRAPGFEVGTRRNEISAGMNLSEVFNVIVSVSFRGLLICASFIHCRLNCRRNKSLLITRVNSSINIYLQHALRPQYRPVPVLIQQNPQVPAPFQF